MLGDWVCTEHDSTPRQIAWIRTGEVGLFWNKVATPPYLVPIPLTPEILEKNGFKYINEEPFFVGWEQYGMVLDKRAGGGFSVSILIATPIDYVHELQHLLRLLKIDKEIEL